MTDIGDIQGGRVSPPSNSGKSTPPDMFSGTIGYGLSGLSYGFSFGTKGFAFDLQTSILGLSTKFSLSFGPSGLSGGAFVGGGVIGGTGSALAGYGGKAFAITGT